MAKKTKNSALKGGSNYPEPEKEKKGRERSPDRKLGIAICVISLFALVGFINTLDNDFVFDDKDIFVHKKEITSFTYIPEVLGFAGEPREYRPVRLISYMVDYFFSGLNPAGYHFFNIFYHTIAACFVYLILFQITKEHKTALLAALIFTIHPVQTDSVSYAAGRRDILFALFYLMGFYYFFKYKAVRKKGYAFLVLFLYILGLYTKEMAVTLPLAILCYDILSSSDAPGLIRRIWSGTRKAFQETRYLYISLFVFALLFSLNKAMVINPSKLSDFHGGSASVNFLTVAKILVHYVKLLFFPLNLNADYSYNAFPVVPHVYDISGLLSLLAVIALFFFALWAIPKNRNMAFAGLWFFLTLLPTCHIVPHHELLAEHYLYLPMFGFALFFSLIVSRLIKAGHQKKMVYSVAAVIIFLFMARTMVRNGDWQDDFTLWTKTVQTAPDCARARNNLGMAQMARGHYRSAVSELKKAVEIMPRYSEAFSNLGVAYGALRNFDQAAKYFEKSIEIDPHFAPAYYNTGLAYANKGDLDKARDAFEKAVDLDPKMAGAHYSLGVLFRKTGQENLSIQHLKEAIRINPKSPAAKDARGLLSKMGGAG